MNNRKIIIISQTVNIDDINKYIISKFDPTIEFDIFSKENNINSNIKNCNIINIPSELNSQVKIKNYIIKYYKSQNFNGFIHILEDTIEILKSPTEFIDDIEKMMNLLDINSYLGTVTDVCNRIYTKYNPRLRIILDKPEYEKFGLNQIVFCSHSNTQWMTFNIEKADENELYFNDQFTVAMFWIIEYLARRRNTHPNSLYYMNQYLTVPSELGVYQNRKINNSDININQEIMLKENTLFTNLHINHEPNNNIDEILEQLYNKLNTKI